ncbi:MAG TPA: TetR family transcriptional regulator [Candidatus Saccharimonadales bacterium]|nr:TetR family transcriptional regulator [Candidatus Saccharimonadales bacterium]
MHSNNSSSNQDKSFIEQARRAQIVEATIGVLAEYGYVNTSFSKIAKKAGISASLISYHFTNKEELTEEVYATINQQRTAHVGERIALATTASDKLRGALEADLTFMGARPELFQALIEILFVARGKDGAPLHREDAVHAGFVPIADILKQGQASGEFGQFDVFNTAIIIDSARDGFLGQLAGHPEFNLKQFTRTLIDTAFTIVKKEQA